MEHINALADMGLGKSCILIGNGPSVRTLPEGIFRIGMNSTPVVCDMIIYYDKEVAAEFDKRDAAPADKLLGLRTRNGKIDNTSRYCTHYYTERDMIFGDTGFHVLQFADRIFNFSRIYLAGYDYSIDGRSYHFYEGESDPAKLERFQKWSIGRVLDMYESIDWRNEIYNLNADSALKVFPYKKI
jgi:hypothetical protein